MLPGFAPHRRRHTRAHGRPARRPANWAEALETRRLLAADMELVANFWPGREFDPHGLTTFDGKVYFAATVMESASHTRVWSTDGTAAGTLDLAGHDSGTYWRNGDPVKAGDTLYFHGNVGMGSAVWATDGTPAGTTRLSVRDGGWNNNTETNTWGAALGGRAVFLGDVAPSNPTRAELFITDGTDAGTVNLTGSLGGAHAAAATVLGSHNGLAYFTDVTPQDLYRLGVTDGTVAGTRIIADLNTGAGLLRPEYFTAVGDKVYFQVDTGQGLKIWKSDGTPAGTGPLDTTLVAVPGTMAELGGRLYFLGAPYTRGVAQLYRTDGTRDGTQLVANIDFNSYYGARSNLTRAGDYLWFDNLHPIHRDDGRGGVWRSAGTAAGTVQVLPDANAGRFFPFGDRLYLGGVSLMIDLDRPSEVRHTGLRPSAPPTGYGPPLTLTEMGGHVYFPHERGLWRAEIPTEYLANVNVVFFHDADGDGTRDEGEGPLPEAGGGAYVDVNDDGNRTGDEPGAGARADGSATIIGVEAGRAVVRAGANLVRFTTPQTVTIDVAPGQDPPTVYFGINRNFPVSGTVYDDLDADSVRDATDAPLEGRRVWLDADNDGQFDEGEPSAVTDASGAYRFAHLREGWLRVEMPQGWRGTQNGGGVMHWVSLPPRDSAYDFGQTTQPLPGSVRADVFLDFDGDGARGPSDPLGGSGRAFLDADADGVLDPDERVRPVSAGRVEFTGVVPGTYTLRLLPMPGWSPSTPAAVVEVRPEQLTAAPALGMKPSAEPGSVTGVVYNDDDFDGVRDAGEPGLRLAPVFLDLDGNGTPAPDEPRTYTDHTGAYRFPGLSPGAYRVVAQGEAAGTFATPVSPRNPAAHTVTFDGTTPGVADFAFATPDRTARLTGRVYRDVNNDGTFNEGDVPVPNVRVYSTSSTALAVSGPDGGYVLPVAAGTHIVSAATPPWWTSNPASGVRVTAVALQTTAGPDFRLTPPDFGGAPLPAAIVGTVFHDADGDGARDPAERAPSVFNGPAPAPPYLDLDRDGFRDPQEPTAQLDDRGNFAFAGLAPGTYDVRLVEANGHAQTSPLPAPHTVTLAAGERSAPVEFGYAHLPARITGTVYLDANRNGRRDEGEGPAAGATVATDSNRSGVVGDDGDGYTTANAAGEFTFANLSPGRYLFGVGGGNRTWGQTDPAGGAPIAITVGPGQQVSGLVFGAARTASNLSGTLFYDNNRNGVRDGDDPAYMAGWTVRLQDTANPAISRTARTDSSGRWSLDAVPPGRYRLSLDMAAPTFELTGALAAPPHEYVLDLAPGVDRADLHFGVHVKPFGFTGDVFDDPNGNGAWEKDRGERGRAGVTMYLDVDDNRTLDPGDPTAVTDANGRFSFANIDLPISRYVFRAVRPPRSVRTFPYPQFNDIYDYLTTIDAAPGQTAHVGEMGFLTPTSHYISGTVFLDANGNGRRDDGEPPIQGRTVGLDQDYDGDFDQSDQFAYTDADGWYAFVRFDARAQYNLRQVLPHDWVGTLPANGGWNVVTGGSSTETYDGVNFGSRPWATVVDRRIFYAAPAVAPAAVDGAETIAADKAVLLPGRAPSFENVTTYVGGITGVAIDVARLPSGPGHALTADDFEFHSRAGDGDPWATAPAPSSVTVRRGAGAGGADRLLLAWPHAAIRNTWLRVTLKPTANTGVREPDVFLVGNLVGETGDRGSPLRVTALDLLAVRRNLTRPGETADLTSRYDFNRDRRVNALDVAALRSNLNRALRPVTTAPAPSAAPAAVTTFSSTPVLLTAPPADQQILRKDAGTATADVLG